MYLDEMDIQVEEDGKELEKGWAERPDDGDTIGDSNEPRHRTLMDKWIDLGEHCNERRMTAVMMLPTIRAMFPRNYDYPSERHTKTGLLQGRELRSESF